MHELSIAESIITSVLEEKLRQKLGEIRTIVVKIGSLSGVLPDALDFCFEAAISETPLSGCSLKIEEVPARGNCQACGSIFNSEDFVFACSECGSPDVSLISGFELDISHLEVVDNGGEHPD
jgi:hydrogenase nickel incorporation protein HypA/HybF